MKCQVSYFLCFNPCVYDSGSAIFIFFDFWIWNPEYNFYEYLNKSYSGICKNYQYPEKRNSYEAYMRTDV